MAGQMIMQGFVGFRIPVAVRRLLTMVPAFVVVAISADANDNQTHRLHQPTPRAI